jgi:predicted nucleic acid-binding Zn ribbon protein
MGTYNIPRNTKGEGKILYIFSTKALIYTVAGIILGVMFKSILGIFGKAFKGTSGFFSILGIVLIVIFAILGFVIGTIKVPHNDRFEICKKAAGINLDKVIWESIKFHFKKSKYYVYDTRELTREEIQTELKEEAELREKEEKLRAEKAELKARNRRGYIK